MVMTGLPSPIGLHGRMREKQTESRKTPCSSKQAIFDGKRIRAFRSVQAGGFGETGLQQRK
jgi:hypothetical protein